MEELEEKKDEEKDESLLVDPRLSLYAPG